MKIIGIGSDHAGYEMKEFVKQYLSERGMQYNDFGTYSVESSDYPDYAHPLAYAIEKGEVSLGIAICGTGNGIAITLNKHQGIRAALCWEEEIAQLAVGHNNANVLVLPGRFISKEKAALIIEVFLTTEFEGGRHQRRIDKIPL